MKKNEFLIGLLVSLTVLLVSVTGGNFTVHHQMQGS